MNPKSQPTRQSADGQRGFPPFRSLPEYHEDGPYRDGESGPHWCFVGEITRNASLVRPVYHVRDLEGNTVVVGFYLDDDSDFDRKKYKVGNTICVMHAKRKLFLDGSHGIRVEELRTVQGSQSCFSCSLQCFHVPCKS